VWWWKENFKANLQEIWLGIKWIYLAQDRDQWMALAYTVMNFQVLYNVKTVLSKCATAVFTIMTQFYEISELILANTWRKVHVLPKSLRGKIRIAFNYCFPSQSCVSYNQILASAPGCIAKAVLLNKSYLPSLPEFYDPRQFDLYKLKLWQVIWRMNLGNSGTLVLYLCKELR
jgi:hypothetical protein